ncbi:MAG: BBP7 family outer membrane beta-barrel protein [Thermoguttaceae bacterium]
MNMMRMGLFCALAGWMAADARAQMGTYGSPDPIPLGQYAPRGSYALATIGRTSSVAAADVSPTLPPAPSGQIPPVPSESSAISSMLSEPGPTVSPSSDGNVLPSGGYIKDAGNCDTCGDVCGGCNSCCSRWYASLDALYMTRNQPGKVYTSAEASSQVNQGYFNDVNWTWGGQGTVGYRFGCCCEWAVEGTYWGLAESCSDGGPGIPGPYVTPMTFGLTDILGTTGGTGAGGAQQANSWTDNSPDHHIWRNYDAQNVEFNVVRNLFGGECNRVGVDFIAGVRWFRFQDGFVFGAQRQNDAFDPYAGDWLYLNDHITNDLIGAQIGCNASYRFADCWRVFITPKVGVYDNHMTLDYNVYAVGNGTQYQASSQTYTNPNYPVHATTDGFAFLTQVDLGLDWQITRHVSTQFGYRVMAMTGIGLSDSQIPFYGNDTQAIADIHHNDSLILHGAFGGLTFSW